MSAGGGHSYIVYAPLLAGCTTLLYEGKPVGTPTRVPTGAFIAEYGVKTCSPRGRLPGDKRRPQGALLGELRLSRFRYLSWLARRLDPETYSWGQRAAGRAVIDHWWQTETGWPIAANLMGLDPWRCKPARRPCPCRDSTCDLRRIGRRVGPRRWDHHDSHSAASRLHVERLGRTTTSFFEA